MFRRFLHFMAILNPNRKQILLCQMGKMNHILRVAEGTAPPAGGGRTMAYIPDDIPLTHIFGTIMMSEMAVLLAVIIVTFCVHA